MVREGKNTKKYQWKLQQIKITPVFIEMDWFGLETEIGI